MIFTAGRPEDQALESLRIISEAVAAHGRLETINLSDNALGEKGVRAFAAGLRGQVQPQTYASNKRQAWAAACG